MGRYQDCQNQKTTKKVTLMTLENLLIEKKDICFVLEKKSNPNGFIDSFVGKIYSSDKTQQWCFLILLCLCDSSLTMISVPMGQCKSGAIDSIEIVVNSIQLNFSVRPCTNFLSIFWFHVQCLSCPMPYTSKILSLIL